MRKQTQNKANFNPKMRGSNPIQTQSKPIQTQFRRPKMKVIAWKGSFAIVFRYLLAKTYHPVRVPKIEDGKAKQTQFKSKRIQFQKIHEPAFSFETICCVQFSEKTQKIATFLLLCHSNEFGNFWSVLSRRQFFL